MSISRYKLFSDINSQSSRHHERCLASGIPVLIGAEKHRPMRK